MTETIFTGQIAVDEKVDCYCGKGKVHLRHDAWFDPYRGKDGQYVHEKCLSEKRKKEIKNKDIS